MARRLKQTTVKTGDYGLVMPIGSTSDRPVVAANGQMRYNSTTSKLELFLAGAWVNFAKIGNVTIVKDTFTGNAAGNTFVMSQTETDPNAIVVYVGNVHQQSTVGYTLPGNTQIIFTSIPANGVPIEVYHNFSSTNAA